MKKYCYFLQREITVHLDNKNCNCIDDTKCKLGKRSSDGSEFITCPTCGYGVFNLSLTYRSVTDNNPCIKCTGEKCR
jgi:hypothetical protein